MSNNDLISREYLRDAFDNLCCHNCKTCRNFRVEDSFYKCALIDNAPTVERPQGEWITKGYEPFGKCNICGGICEINNFCGHCGVKMKYNTEK